MKRKAVILFLTILFTLSLKARSKSDSTTIHLDTLKAHRVHVFWQYNSIFCLNLILNTEVRIYPKLYLSVRTGYKINPQFLDKGLYPIGSSFRRYATGYLAGVKLLRTFYNQPGIISYYGLGFDFDYFNFPYTETDGVWISGISILKEGDPLEVASGKYQTYSIYGIIGLQSFHFLSAGVYFGLGARIKSYQTKNHFEGYYNGGTGFSKNLPKDFYSVTPFLTIGINIGK